MTPNEYAKAALRTRKKMSKAKQLRNARLGLAAEAGEVANVYKKHHYQSPLPDYRNQMLLELGDVCWYVALLASVTGERMRDLGWERDIDSVYVPETKETLILLLNHYVNESPDKISLGMIVECIVALLYKYDLSVQHAWRANIAKLEARYPRRGV